MIRDLLESLRARCDEPCVLAGFSQGGMLACDSVLMEAVEVAGLAIMSASGIAGAEWLGQRGRLEGVPAFVSHGRSDPDLSFAAGQRLASFLTSGGAATTAARPTIATIPRAERAISSSDASAARSTFSENS